MDGAVNGLANLIAAVSRLVRRIQTGRVQHYATIIVLGAVFVVAIMLAL